MVTGTLPWQWYIIAGFYRRKCSILMTDSQIPAQAASLKAQADKHRDQGDFSAAAESYRAALELAPHFWQAHANLSMLLAESGDHGNSVTHAEKAVQIMPEMAELLDNLGVIYREAGRYPEAVKAHKRATEKSPSLISAYFNLGLDYVKNGELQEAVTAFRKVIEINPNVPEAHLYVANLLLQQNRPGEAEAYFRAVLNFNPAQPAAIHSLGQCLQDQGKLEEAVEAYRQVIQLNPKSAGSYFNLGVAQQEQTLLDDAVDSYTKALSLDSKICDAYFNLGVISSKRDGQDDAVAWYRKALRCNPRHEGALVSLADILRTQDALDDAVTYLSEAIAINPKSFEAHMLFGNILKDRGESEKVVEAFRQATEINPKSKEAHNNLGLALRDQGRMAEAIASLRCALNIDPDYTDGLYNLGRAYEMNGDLDEAESAYQHVLEIDSQYLEAIFRLGIVCNDRGDKEEALACFRRVLSIDPESSKAYQVIAKTKKHTEYDAEIAAMESLHGKEGNTVEQNKGYAFGLAKAYEDLGEYEKAFEYMREGNQLKRTTFNYSIEQEQGIFDGIKKVFDRDLLNASVVTGVQDKTPIFIVGMPRSGTTLTEQILASHPQVYGAGELVYMDSIISQLREGKNASYSLRQTNEAVFLQIGTEYMGRIRALDAEAPRITDKMPHNFLNIGYIRKALPNAKIIHCRRDPMDNCLSIFKQEFAGSLSFAYDQEELGRYYLLYEDLMRHWHEAMPGIIYDIQYEELVADQESQTRKLLEYCGLPWDDACLSFHKTERRVATASFTQVRQPIYRDSVQLWKRYERQLEPLRRIIESRPRD